MHRTKKKRKMKRQDALLKVYFHDPYRFADFIEISMNSTSLRCG